MNPRQKMKHCSIDSPNSLWGKIWRKKNYHPSFLIEQKRTLEEQEKELEDMFYSFSKCADYCLRYKQERPGKRSPRRLEKEKIKSAMKILGKNSPILLQVRNKISVAHRESVSYYLNQKEKIRVKRESQFQNLFNELQNDLRNLLMCQTEGWKKMRKAYTETVMQLAVNAQEEKSKWNDNYNYEKISRSLSFTLDIHKSVRLEQRDCDSELVLLLPQKNVTTELKLDTQPLGEFIVPKTVLSLLFSHSLSSSPSLEENPILASLSWRLKVLEIPSFVKGTEETQRSWEYKCPRIRSEDVRPGNLSLSLPLEKQRDLWWCKIGEMILKNEEGEISTRLKIDATYLPGWNTFPSETGVRGSFVCASKLIDTNTPSVLFWECRDSESKTESKIPHWMTMTISLQGTSSRSSLIVEEFATDFSFNVLDGMLTWSPADSKKVYLMAGLQNKVPIIWDTPVQSCQQKCCRLIRLSNVLLHSRCPCPFWLFDPNSWTVYEIKFESLKDESFLCCSVWEMIPFDMEKEKQKEEEKEESYQGWFKPGKWKEPSNSKWKKTGDWKSSIGNSWPDEWQSLTSCLQARGGYVLFSPSTLRVCLHVMEGKTGRKIGSGDPWHLSDLGMSFCLKMDVFHWKNEPFFVLTGDVLVILNAKGKALYVDAERKREQFNFISDYVFWKRKDKFFIAFMPIEFWLTQLKLSLFE